MKIGSLADKIVVRDFKTNRFIPYLYRYASHGCGANALSLLTGVPPTSFKPRPHWSDTFMVRFLRSKGFKVKEITVRGITNYALYAEPLSGAHVMLSSIQMNRDESSWVVLHNGQMYHNFEITIPGYERALDHPIISSYLIFHPSWRVKMDIKLTSKELLLI